MSESGTYQAMLSEVENIVTELSSNQLDLDSMVNKVERSYELIKKMRHRLDSTKEKVEQLRVEFEGSMSPENPSSD